MLARGNSAYGDREFFADDRGFESQEDLAEENTRLKQELTRIRRHRSSSFAHHDHKFNDPRRSTLGAMHGRTQEQLREVIEENDNLNEKLKIKEQELKELTQELQEVRDDYTKLREKISEDERREFEDDETTEKESKDHPKDIRLFKRHAQDMMRRLKEEKEQDLAKADQAKKLLKMQLEDSQKRCERSKAEVYRVERELSQSEANHAKTKAALQDLQHHYDEVRGMLEGQKDAAELMRVKVRHLEEELETERLRSSIGTRHSNDLDRSSMDMGDTLDMLDGYMNPRFTVESSAGDLPNSHGADENRGADPEISGQLKEQLAELHQECEHLRSQLALAEKVQAQQEASRSALASSGTAAANAQQEQLRQECEGLRGRLGAAEAGLAQAQRERESLHQQLAQSKEAAEAARRSSADVRAGLVSRAEELQRECDRLREQLTSASAGQQQAQRERESLQEQLAHSNEAAEAAWRASADARAGLTSRAEELQRECDRLREQLTSATADLAQTQRQRESLHQHLAQSKEAAEAAWRSSADSRAGLTSRTEELQRECDGLREQLAGATAELAQAQREREGLQEQLVAQSQEAAEAARRSPADARTGLESRAEELQRECDRLREQLASAAAPPSSPAGVNASLEDRSEKEQLQQRLAEAQLAVQRASEDSQATTKECERLRQQLVRAEELEQEMREESDRLRQQLSDTVELQQAQQRDAGVVAARPALAGAAAPVAASQERAVAARQSLVAVTQEGNRLLAGERTELLKRNEELLHECHDLRERLQAAESKEVGDMPAAVEELRARRLECAELRERLHTARMAELEAHRKADIVPELMTKIIDLQAQVAAAERDASDWRELASGPSWANMFSSFMCAVPERRPARGA